MWTRTYVMLGLVSMSQNCCNVRTVSVSQNCCNVRTSVCEAMFAGSAAWWWLWERANPRHPHEADWTGSPMAGGVASVHTAAAGVGVHWILSWCMSPSLPRNSVLPHTQLDALCIAWPCCYVRTAHVNYVQHKVREKEVPTNCVLCY
jgi:hypothetical protein